MCLVQVKRVVRLETRGKGRQGPAVYVFTDLVALFTSVAATYAVVRAWRYVTSCWPQSPSRPRSRSGEPNTAVHRVSKSTHMEAKLSQIAATIKASENACKALPVESEIEEQITELEDVCTALSNDALRLRVNELLGRLRSNAATEQSKHYQEIMKLLSEEKHKQSADLRLVAHYESTINEYVGALDPARSGKRDSGDQLNLLYLDEVMTPDEALLDFTLHHEVPEGVRFYEAFKTFESGSCGQPVFDIEFEIRGQPIKPRDVDHALGQSVLQTIEQSIKQRVGASRCPEHGSAVKIIVSGNSLGKLTWHAPGCCPILLATVQAKLTPNH